MDFIKAVFGTWALTIALGFIAGVIVTVTMMPTSITEENAVDVCPVWTKKAELKARKETYLQRHHKEMINEQSR